MNTETNLNILLYTNITLILIMATLLLVSIFVIYKLTKQSFSSSSALQTELLALKAMNTLLSETSPAGVQMGHAILNHKREVSFPPRTTLPKQTNETPPTNTPIPQGAVRVTQRNPD
jgi:hypothetical protein